MICRSPRPSPITWRSLVLTLLKVYYAYQQRSWLAIFLCLTGVVLWPLDRNPLTVSQFGFCV